jgi:hypothetical protein
MWKLSSLLGATKFWQDYTKEKVMLEVFFNRLGTVNKVKYKEVLSHIWETSQNVCSQRLGVPTNWLLLMQWHLTMYGVPHALYSCLCCTIWFLITFCGWRTSWRDVTPRMLFKLKAHKISCHAMFMVVYETVIHLVLLVLFQVNLKLL